MNGLWNSVEKLDSLVTAANWGIALTLLVAFACTVLAIKAGGRKDALTHAIELAKAERIANLDTANLTLQGQVAILQTDASVQQERAAKAEANIALAEQHAAEANAKAEGFRLDIAKANEGAAHANEIAEQERLARIKIEERMGGWKLSKDAQDSLSKALKPFAGTHFSLAANPIEEPFVETVDRILRDAGWIREAPLDDNGHAATVLLSDKAMVAFSSGLSVVISQDEWAALSPAADAYKQALLVDGFEVKLLMAVPPANKIAPTVIKFNIGKRE